MAKEFNKVAATTRKAKAGTFEMKEPKKREIPPPRKGFESEAEILAQSKFHKKSWYFEGGREAFPYRPDMWFVQKMFPYAQGGELLIDEPSTDEETAKCKEKGKFLRQAGYKYVILKNGVDEIDIEEKVRSK